MESALYLIDWERWKRVILLSLIIVFGLLIPSIVVADVVTGFDSQKLIGITGAADSQLLIGLGSGSGLLHIALGGSHFHEDDPAFQIVSLAPLLYVLLLIFVLIGLIAHISLRNIIIGVVAIYLGSALLQGMQTLITNLLR